MEAAPEAESVRQMKIRPPALHLTEQTVKLARNQPEYLVRKRPH
jgi:hypothetical protein